MRNESKEEKQNESEEEKFYRLQNEKELRERKIHGSIGLVGCFIPIAVIALLILIALL
jgi:hypothetical protein